MEAKNIYEDDRKYEIHNGQIVSMSPSACTNHGRVIRNIVSVFSRFLKGKPCEVWSDTIDVHFTDKDTFIPDITVVCNPKIVKETGIFGAPDLVAEVLSPGTAKSDKGYKKNIYEKCGVKEYWIVSIEARSVEVYLLEDGRLELDDVYSIYPDWMLESILKANKEKPVTEFSPSIFPDMKVTLDEVFEKIT